MWEVRILLDDIDYDALANLLLPLAADKLAEKGGVLSLLGRNKEGVSGVARQMLRGMSQEKRDEFLLQLLQDKKGELLSKANRKSQEAGAGVHVADLSVRIVKNK